jgi:hypothetical protein
MSSTLYGVDSTNQNQLVFVYTNYPTMYPGQTTILRYNLTLNDTNYYNIKINLTSSLASGNTDKYEVQRMIISNVGDNYPCGSLAANFTTLNG